MRADDVAQDEETNSRNAYNAYMILLDPVFSNKQKRRKLKHSTISRESHKDGVKAKQSRTNQLQRNGDCESKSRDQNDTIVSLTKDVQGTWPVTDQDTCEEAKNRSAEITSELHDIDTEDPPHDYQSSEENVVADQSHDDSEAEDAEAYNDPFQIHFASTDIDHLNDLVKKLDSKSWIMTPSKEQYKDFKSTISVLDEQKPLHDLIKSKTLEGFKVSKMAFDVLQ